MPALNVPLIGESQSALHWRVAERNPGTRTPARREKFNTPRSARVVGTCAPQTWEPTSPRGHPRWAPGAHLRGAAAPVLDAGPPAAGGGVRGFPTPPSGWKRWLLPGATSASQAAGGPAGPRARDPRRSAAPETSRAEGPRRRVPIAGGRERARLGVGAVERPGCPGERGLGFPGAAAWPATRWGGEGAAASCC